MNLAIGSTVGDYEIIGILGAGGMGAVYKVRNTISDRVEALKVLLPDLASQPDLAERFLREIKLHASLEHPNIAAMRTALWHENQLLLVMELVPGVSLAERRKQGSIPLPDALDYIGQVLLALSYAHGRGVVHRDIKPANMMLTPGGAIKLMDFGIAKGEADLTLTKTGTTLGSLYYISPEQIRGAAGVDSRSDLYSLGVCLYELVTSKRPFEGESQFDLMSAHLEQAPTPPIAIDPSLPKALNDLILMSLNKDPADRFQTADAFRNALTNFHAPAAVQPAVKPVAPPPPTRRPRRGLWVAAGGLCTALALIAVIQFGPWKKTAASGDPLPPAPQVVADPVPAAVVPPLASEPAAPAKPASQLVIPQSAPVGTPAAAQPSKPAKPASQVIPPSPRPVPETVERPIAPPTGTPTPMPPAAPASKPPDLQPVRESLAMMSARAASIRSTLQNLQRNQAAGGLGLRGDWLEAANLMDTFLRGANDALAAADAPAARDFMNKAERQVEKLEKALNK